MNQDIERILYSEEALSSRVRELGEAISRDFEGKNPVIVGILKGSFVFMADLIRSIVIPCTLDFMALLPRSQGSRPDWRWPKASAKADRARLAGKHRKAVKKMIRCRF